MGAKLSRSHTIPLISFDKEAYLKNKPHNFDDYKKVSPVNAKKKIQKHNQEIGKLLIKPDVRLILKYLDNIKNEYDKEQYLYSYRPSKKIFKKNNIKRHGFDDYDNEYMNIIGIILFSTISIDIKKELITEIVNMCQYILRLPCVCQNTNNNCNYKFLTPINTAINFHHPISMLKLLLDRNMTLISLDITLCNILDSYPIDLLSSDDKIHLKDFIRQYLDIINNSLVEIANNIDDYDYDIYNIIVIKTSIEFSLNKLQLSLDVVDYVDLLSDVTGNLNILYVAYILRTIAIKSKIKESEITLQKLKSAECCICLDSCHEIETGNRMGITVCGHAICENCSGSINDECYICRTKFDLSHNNIYYYSLNNFI